MAISKKRSAAAANGNRKLGAPFDPKIARQAKTLAARYQVVLRYDDECGAYYGRGLELPGALGDGKTPDACVASTRRAMAAVAAFMLERGETPPTPAAEGLRKVQL